MFDDCLLTGESTNKPWCSVRKDKYQNGFGFLSTKQEWAYFKAAPMLACDEL